MSRTARLGAFILFTLIVLAIGIFIIGGKKFLFSTTYGVKTEFADVAGLQTGADVMVGGVQSGVVQSIELPHTPNGKVTVRLQLKSSTHDIIKQDSLASIQTEGLLGNQYVAVSFGSDGKPEVKDGDTIGSVPPLQMAALLDKASGLLDSGQKALDNVTQVSEHLNAISAKIDKGNGTVGALVNDRQLYDNANQTVATLKQTAGTLNETAIEAKKSVASAQTGIQSFSENMEALKHNFLLSGYFKKRGYEDSSELGRDEVDSLPQATPVKEFTFQAKDLFDKEDSAKLKGQKRLNPAGEYLAANEFGVAIIEVSTGKAGEVDKDKVLAQGRALVVHDYLTQHYGFDDNKLKTVAVGKQTNGDATKKDWGEVRVLIYSPDTPIPASKVPGDGSSSEKPPATGALPMARWR